VAGEVKAVVGEVDGATYAHNVGESSHTLEFDPPAHRDPQDCERRGERMLGAGCEDRVCGLPRSSGSCSLLVIVVILAALVAAFAGGAVETKEKAPR